MRTYTFPSSSGAGAYTTTLADDGKLLCNCKGWTMRRGTSPRHCKHTKKVAAGAEVAIRGEFVYLQDGVIATPPLVEAQQYRRDDDVIECDDCERGYGPGARCRCTDARQFAPPSPMLASAMTTLVTAAAFDKVFASGWLMEEKLDGHRCVVVVRDGEAAAWSRPRAGKTANRRTLTAPILAQLRRFPDGVFDGELVAPGGKSWNVAEVGNHLVFVIFDMLRVNEQDLTRASYGERRRFLLDVLQASLDPKQTAISTVESVTPSWAGIEAIWRRGGEGVIVKRRDSTYRPGSRTPEWVKVKQQLAATLTVVGFEPGKTGPQSTLRLRDTAGVETTVKVRGNALQRQVDANPPAFLGKRVVITYQEKTPAGSYRHGIFDHFAGVGE